LTVLLLAALMRFPALDRVPPGWRDDELIEIGMDMRIQQGWRPLYIREAEGHEPLYHYLHAFTLTLFGHNTYGYRWLPAACGTLSTALLVMLVRRLFGFDIAALTGALYGVGMWPVFYSRFGVRHIGVMPFVLLALYGLTQTSCVAQGAGHRLAILRWGMLVGAAMGLGLYVYYAAWTLPVLVVALGVYLFMLDRPRFRQAWLALALALIVAAVIFAPLGLELTRGPKVTRIEVTGAPLWALLEGDVWPVIRTTIGTLGMFTFSGDPEWLYNVSGLPVFDWIAGSLFYIGLIVCVLRWRDGRFGLALVWLVVGIAPAFISIPPGSFSHTIAAQGVVYLMPAIGAVEIANIKSRVSALKGRLLNLMFILLVFWVALYTLRFYFRCWPIEGMVRFMYHADTHDLARWLDAQAEGGDLAISTTSNELMLEGLALSFDLKRKDIVPRFFDAEWALVFPRGGGQRIALLSYPPQVNPLLGPLFEAQLIAEHRNPATGQIIFRVYRDVAAPGSRGSTSADAPRVGNLTLMSYTIPILPPRGGEGWLLTIWRVDGPLADPLKLFVHLLDASSRLVGHGDRLNVLASSLRPGDVFAQLNPLLRPADADCAPCRIELGLYNPATNERLPASTGDHLVLPVVIEP